MIDALSDAIYRTVHDGHPRGAVGLAPLVGMKPGTLNNKADPAHDSEMTLRESIPMMRQTRDYQILATLAAAVDHAVIPLGDFSSASDVELLDKYCDYHAELGQTAEAVRACLNMQGGRVMARDVRKVQREMIEDMQAGLAFLARLEAIAEPDDDDD